MDNEKKQVTYNSSITGETQVTFDIQQYMNNRAMFIGLMCNEDGYEEPFGDVTVNLSVAAPNYCGYLNVNDMPDIEKFITDNDIGEFTGFTQRSGFCEYPASEFLRLYPSANILVATERDFEKSRRKQFVSRIATGD